jgi:hypothetical protein
VKKRSLLGELSKGDGRVITSGVTKGEIEGIVLFELLTIKPSTFFSLL